MQIGLNSDDRDYVRFLWFANVNKINFLNLNNIKLVVYRFSRVFVGVASSPLLLSTTLISHITQFYHLDPKFAVSLLNSLQVNDMSGGSHTIYWAFDFFMKCEESLDLRRSHLQKFQSNSKELENLVADKFHEGISNDNTVLGLIWNKNSDKVGFDYENM